MKKLAVMSMSGGLDSATLAAEALNQDFDIFVLNFNYNQKNSPELQAFCNLIAVYETKYRDKIIGVKQLDLKPLFNEFLDIWAQMRDSGEIKEKAEHEFYTPSRNLLFAVMSAVIGEIVALSKNYDEVYIGLGIHQHTETAYGKHRNYWDITPEFAERLQQLLALNDVKTIKLFTPFVNMYKKDIVKRAIELGVPYALTWTCYNPDIKENVALPCGKCEACIERQLAGEAAGVNDINDYAVFLGSECIISR
jgi:7-cyano-7-deazaguanine synthase